MAAELEIASAYIALRTKMPGVGKDISSALGSSEVSGALDGAATSTGSRFGAGFGKALAAAGLVAGVVSAFKGLYEVGSTFDDVSDTIRVKTGATGDSLQELNDIVFGIATTIPTSFGAAGETVATLTTRMGLSGDTLQTVASQFLEAGRLLGEEIDVDAATGALNAFRIEGDEVSGAMDHLFQVSQATGVGMNELAAAVQANAPAMQNLGFSYEETTALIGSLDKAGLDSTGTLAAMSRGLVNLARDGEEPQEAFRRVTGEIQSLIDSGESAAAIDLASGVFGTKAAIDMVGAVESGTLAFGDLIGAAGLSGDSILGAAEETSDFAEQWQIVQNKAGAALEPLGSTVFEALGGALDWMMPGLTAFGEWVSDNSDVIGVIAAAFGVLAIAVGVYTIAQWAMNSALLASPITWIIVGVVALIAAIVLLVMHWDEVVAWISEIWGGFVGWLTDLLEGLAGWWDGVWSGIIGFFEDIWNGLIDWFMSIPMFKWLIETIMFLAANWDAIWAAIGKTFEDVWNGIGDFFRGVANWVLDGIEGFINGAIDLINGILGPINSVAGAIGSVFGQSWSVPLLPHVRIPRLAEGALIEHRPGGVLANIGEGRYNEAVIPLGGPQFDRLADSLAKRIGAGSGAGSTRLDKDSIDMLASAIVRSLRRQDRMGET